MSRIPDFTKVEFTATAAGSAPASAPAAAEAWVTPEGIPVKPVYTGSD